MSVVAVIQPSSRKPTYFFLSVFMIELSISRYSLIRVRENAESIAFYGGVQQELNEVQRRFGKALDNFDRVIRAQRNLEFFTTGYRYLIQVCISCR